MLKLFKEGQVYEVLLVTKSNETPIGVVRRGNLLFFKLFRGKSAEDIKAHPYAAIQITNDPLLLVRLALNLPTEMKFEGDGPYRWIKDLPGFKGTVRWNRVVQEDELGKSDVLRCEFTPLSEIRAVLPPKPISRCDHFLLEMGVAATRLPVALRNNRLDAAEKLMRAIIENYRMYRKLGGTEPLADLILDRIKDLPGLPDVRTIG